MKKILLSALVAATIASGNSEVAPQDNINSFLESVNVKGDLRLRYENKDHTYRNRYRLRYSLSGNLNDNLRLETAISSGRGNPTSGNVTFRDGTSLSNYLEDLVEEDKIKLDIADIKYSFDNSWLRVGKAKHHIYRPVKTQLIWDNDIRLEGVNYGYKDDSTMIRLGVNQVHREEEPSGSKDINIFLAQYVKSQKLSYAKLNLGTGYYYYDGVKGNTTPYGSNKGNSVDGNALYTEDYGILETFAELKYKDVMGMPFKTALTLAYNTQANDNNFGYDISAQLGATKNIGDWKAGVTYRDVEKDSVYGAHNDSDFSGGGTDSKGYYCKVKYKFANNVDVAGWWNWSKLGDTELDCHRTQLDVILKF